MDIKSLNRFVKNGLLPTHTIGLMGNHGIGKTSYVQNTFRKIIAEKHGLPLERVHVECRCVSVMDPADLIGNFQEFGGRTYNCPPSWIPTCKEYDDKMAELYAQHGKQYARLTNYDDIYILFLDECKRGNAIIQDGIMELLLEHRLFGVNLKENTYVVCADNDNAKIYNGTRRDPAQESRIKNFSFAPTNGEFLDYFADRVSEGTFHMAVYSFLKKYPDFIVLPTKTIEELSVQGKKGPSPRDWTQLAETLIEFAKQDDDITTGNQTFLASVATSYVGSSYALKFAEFCEMECRHEIDVNEVLFNFTNRLGSHLKIEFQKNPKAAVTVCHGLLDLVKRQELTDKLSKNILAFLKCCPNEAVAAFLNGWQKEAQKQFLSWRVTPVRYNIHYSSIMNRERKGDKPSAYENWLNTFTRQMGITLEDMDRDDVVLAA